MNAMFQNSTTINALKVYYNVAFKNIYSYHSCTNLGGDFMDEKVLIDNAEACDEASAVSMGSWADEEFWR